ncbi:hypothetical protein BCV72DRAFT_110985 [Rhizopus microsporus var. microsporus]|uniref:PH domain-like protein n=1 Tax=Rhizopus microsporus var. microsporus TaxID=86635 RepID=A0A1X0R5K2_RHIZD|nr:hypothetical protein BCV72DRAFT_110985 [Rhizopus microsporus var. microsporus]
MCDVSDPRILNAYYSITEDEPTDWLLLGYKDSRNVITLYASGCNGLSEFRQHLTNEILFGFVRIEDKFILITYVPDSVSGVRRARALVHSRSVASVCELSHAQITASSLSDLSDSNIRTRLKLGENQVPNRPRPAKRSSVVSTTTRRRKSAQSIPSPSPTPPPILPVPDKRASLIINTSTTTEEPESYATPSTPTSVASFSDTTTVIDCNSSISSSKDYYERIKAEEDAALELHFQTQLLKKRELEEARFKQTLKEQEERREQQNKRIEEERNKTHMEFQLKQKQLAEEREKTNLLKRPSRVFDHNSNNSNSSSNVASTITHTNNNSIMKKVSSHDAMNNTTTITKTNAITTETKKTVVLMSGFVSVQTRNSPFWRRRYFEIESTSKTIMFYKDELSTKTPISTINLLHVTRLAPANEDEDTFVPNSFVIDTQSDDSFQILADDKNTGKKILSTLQTLK